MLDEEFRCDGRDLMLNCFCNVMCYGTYHRHSGKLLFMPRYAGVARGHITADESSGKFEKLCIIF